MITAPSGTGYLGGDPPYVVTAGGLPRSCQIDLYFDKEYAGSTQTLSDGSWRFSYLDLDSMFDVIARGGDLLDDVISSRRTPFDMAVIVEGGPETDVDAISGLSVITKTLPITGTVGPYTFQVVSGDVVDGLIFTDDGEGNLVISGSVSVDPGTFSFRLKVISSIISDYCLIDVLLTVGAPSSSLLHFEGVDGSTTIDDEYPVTWTVSGNCVLSTGQFKFGASSAHFPVGNGCITSSYNENIDLLGGEFTVEVFVYPTGTGDHRIFSTGGTSLNWDAASGIHILIDQNNSGSYDFQIANGSSSPTTSSGGIVVLNTWTHIALSFDADAVRLFVNGIMVASVDDPVIFRPTNDPTAAIGRIPSQGSGNDFVGYMDEFCLTKGRALYTENFTPPTAPFVY